MSQKQIKGLISISFWCQNKSLNLVYFMLVFIQFKYIKANTNTKYIKLNPKYIKLTSKYMMGLSPNENKIPESQKWFGLSHITNITRKVLWPGSTPVHCLTIWTNLQKIISQKKTSLFVEFFLLEISLFYHFFIHK